MKRAREEDEEEEETLADGPEVQEEEPFEPVTDGREMTFEVRTLNPYLSCGLCNGYLREAFTITECLHSCNALFSVGVLC